ncbi:hypothetical protein Droror1_Dr00009307 [Drosera rotundifolia]
MNVSGFYQWWDLLIGFDRFQQDLTGLSTISDFFVFLDFSNLSRLKIMLDLLGISYWCNAILYLRLFVGSEFFFSLLFVKSVDTLVLFVKSVDTLGVVSFKFENKSLISGKFLVFFNLSDCVGFVGYV